MTAASKRFKTRVLNWGTPTQSCHLVILSDDGDEKHFASGINAGELMKYFDEAVREAQELTAKDGVNRSVQIQQTILQKNVWVT